MICIILYIAGFVYKHVYVYILTGTPEIPTHLCGCVDALEFFNLLFVSSSLQLFDILKFLEVILPIINIVERKDTPITSVGLQNMSERVSTEVTYLSYILNLPGFKSAMEIGFY
jgi:hypothetical protein